MAKPSKVYDGRKERERLSFNFSVTLSGDLVAVQNRMRDARSAPEGGGGGVEIKNREKEKREKRQNMQQ